MTDTVAWTDAEHRELLKDVAFERQVSADREAAYTVLADENRRLRDAIRPLVAFASATGFDALPDDHPVTAGSGLARRQITAGDLRRVRDAASSQARPIVR